MNRRLHFAAARIALSMTSVCFASFAQAAPVPVDASEIARCAAISDRNERLGCYDALAAVAAPGVRSAPATGATPAGGVTAGVGPAAGAAAAPVEAANAPGTVAARGPATPAAALASAVSPAPAEHTADPDDPANFGLTRHQLKAIPSGPDSVKAIVSQMTQDRHNNVSLLLDNGQSWAFVEPEPRLRPGDSVTIKRAALGSFLMTTPSRHSYRVQRLK